jgi:AcrR family transcriptional regulator
VDDVRKTALLEAMLAELAGSGYGEISIDRALRRSGATAAEFEAEFGDKDGCLIAAYDHLTGRVVQTATDACGEGEAWPERVRGALTAVLSELAAEPQMASVVFRAFPGVRPSFYRHYVEFLERFTSYLREGRELSPVDEELPAEVELLALGAAEAIIYGELQAGRGAGLPRLMPEILFSILVPFIGPDRAADEMRSAAAAS